MKWSLKAQSDLRHTDLFPLSLNERHINLLTSEDAIKDRAIEAYTERLTKNEINHKLKEFENDTDLLCEIRLNTSKKNTTELWTMDELKVVLKQLKKG